MARSVNFYPIGGEKANDGIVNLAFGLGKTVVDGGNTLRFSPKYPRKTLQLSDPKLALRDTQKTMYALDLRPGAFKISRNDSINLTLRPVTEALEEFPYPEWNSKPFELSDSEAQFLRFECKYPDNEPKSFLHHKWQQANQAYSTPQIPCNSSGKSFWRPFFISNRNHYSVTTRFLKSTPRQVYYILNNPLSIPYPRPTWLVQVL